MTCVLRSIIYHNLHILDITICLGQDIFSSQGIYQYILDSHRGPLKCHDLVDQFSLQ